MRSLSGTRPSPGSGQEKHLPPAHSAAPWRRWRVRLEPLFAVLAIVPVVLFLLAALGRLRCPFPIEQLEGSMLLAAERVAHGLPVYVRPNFQFIPYMYAPAYYYVSGWAVRLLGPGFLALRLVSLLSTCASLALIYFFILLETSGPQRRRHLAALAGAGLYAAAYPWTRQWFDLGRVDSLYILLLLVALLATRFSGRRLHPVVAALAWTLAFLAKQTILPVAVIMLCHDWKRPRRALAGVVSFLAMAGLTVLLLDHVTHGWFRFYAFTVPRANADLLLRPAVFYVPTQLIAPFGVALLIAAAAWIATRPSLLDSRTRFYLLAASSTFALCWFLQGHTGATANTPMPVYAVLAIVFGVSLDRVDGWFAQKTFHQEFLREPARILLLAAAAIPLVSWIYNPHDIIPQHPVVVLNQELVAWLRTFPGDVYLPDNPYEAVAAGKNPHPDNAALHDALRPKAPQVRQPLLDQIRAAIDDEHFDAIAFDDFPARVLNSDTWLPRDLEQHYPLLGMVPGAEIGNRFTPHPVFFLLPCREQALAVSKGWNLLARGNATPCPR